MFKRRASSLSHQEAIVKATLWRIGQVKNGPIRLVGGQVGPFLIYPQRGIDNNNVMRYYASIMIKSFRGSETERLFRREPFRKLPHEIQQTALRKLLMLDAATDLRDLRVSPGNRLEALKHDRRGSYSIRINQKWRICFRWYQGASYDVEITDYH